MFRLAALGLLLAGLVAVPSAARPPEPTPAAEPQRSGPRIVSTGTVRLAKAAGDTVTLYGGPGTTEGSFETVDGAADWQGWIGVDRTDANPFEYWQHSQFNAENLGGHGPGNHAMWCGQTAEQQPFYVAGTGYGRSWDVSLEWSSGPLSDPSLGQTVSLDFLFHYEFEPGYDYLSVEYETPGGWVRTMEVTGTNKTGGLFPAPGVAYTDEKFGDIVYAGNDYGGNGGDEIHLRIRFTSDGAFDDETGLWPTDAGAAQVDDILVQWADEGPQSVFEDFEGVAPFAWQKARQPVAGDFAKLFAGLRDIDPCAENRSVQATFLDDGTPPSNGLGESTGGTVSSYGYAVSGGYVVNNSGGISDGIYELRNEIWSPPIAWDLAGSADDALDGAAELRFDVWADLSGEIRYVWHVRASEDEGLSWTNWQRNPDYWGHQYSGPARHRRVAYQFRDLIPAAVTHVQVALGVRDGYGGALSDPTPGPFFDNVHVLRYRSGPRLAIDPADLFQSSFPPSGLVDPSPSPESLACPIPTTRITYDPQLIGYVPADSTVVEARPLVDGRTLARLELQWQLDANPLFDAVRTLPPGSSLQAGAGIHGFDRWTGTLGSTPLLDQWGHTIDHFFTFDFPDEQAAMFFPGDRLRWYVEAEDDAGGISTLPADVTGFASGVGYDHRFEVHALPSLREDGGSVVQPRLLLVDSADRPWLRESIDDARSEESERPPDLDGIYDFLLRQNGLVEGIDYDRFTVVDASQPGRYVGFAGAWGASLDQLAGYRSLLLNGGRVTSAPTLSDAQSGGNLRGDEVQRLTDWRALPGDRGLALFGDHAVGASLGAGGAGMATFAQDVLGVSFVADDVAPAIGGLSAPLVLPLAGAFTQEFAAVGGCPFPLDWMDLATFDWLEALPGALAAHGFQVAEAPGTTYAGPAASVAFEENPGGDLKRAITFPYDLQSVWTEPSEVGDDNSRTALIGELLAYLDAGLTPSGTPTSVTPPTRAGIHGLSARPNPFNPRTVVVFEVGRRAHYRVEIFDLRGRRVRRLHEGPLASGPQRLDWNGADDHGRAVASGVYLLKVEGDGQIERSKLALVR